MFVSSAFIVLVKEQSALMYVSDVKSGGRFYKATDILQQSTAAHSTQTINLLLLFTDSLF